MGCKQIKKFIIIYQLLFFVFACSKENVIMLGSEYLVLYQVKQFNIQAYTRSPLEDISYSISKVCLAQVTLFYNRLRVGNTGNLGINPTSNNY